MIGLVSGLYSAGVALRAELKWLAQAYDTFQAEQVVASWAERLIQVSIFSDGDGFFSRHSFHVIS